MFLRLIETGNVYEKFCCLLAVTDVYFIVSLKKGQHLLFFSLNLLCIIYYQWHRKTFKSVENFRVTEMPLFIYLFISFHPTKRRVF